jgi:hypothetical protein
MSYIFEKLPPEPFFKPEEIFYNDQEFIFKAKDFVKDFPEDRLHYSSSLLKFYDPYFPQFLIHKGVLKEEKEPGNFFYYYASDLLGEKKTNTLPLFTFYKPPVWTPKPYKDVTILDVHNTLTGTYLKNITDEFRTIRNKAEADSFKRSKFPYCTWSGVFKNGRCEKTFQRHSNYLCLDFDKLENVEKVKSDLLRDEQIEPGLIFVSPSGKGLKLILQIDTALHTHLEYFESCKNYYLKRYKIEADKSGKDIPRACFLCYDPHCYLNPKLLQ